MNSWDNTRKSFVSWLSESDLREEFSKKIIFEDLSFWWLTDLMDKDNVNQTIWYENLNKKLNLDSRKNYSKKINYYLLFFKLIKSFLFKIFTIIFIKIFF